MPDPTPTPTPTTGDATGGLTLAQLQAIIKQHGGELGRSKTNLTIPDPDYPTNQKLASPNPYPTNVIQLADGTQLAANFVPDPNDPTGAQGSWNVDKGSSTALKSTATATAKPANTNIGAGQISLTYNPQTQMWEPAAGSDPQAASSYLQARTDELNAAAGYANTRSSVAQQNANTTAQNADTTQQNDYFKNLTASDALNAKTQLGQEQLVNGQVGQQTSFAQDVSDNALRGTLIPSLIPNIMPAGTSQDVANAINNLGSGQPVQAVARSMPVPFNPATFPTQVGINAFTGIAPYLEQARAKAAQLAPNFLASISSYAASKASPPASPPASVMTPPTSGYTAPSVAAPAYTTAGGDARLAQLQNATPNGYTAPGGH